MRRSVLASLLGLALAAAASRAPAQTSHISASADSEVHPRLAAGPGAAGPVTGAPSPPPAPARSSEPPGVRKSAVPPGFLVGEAEKVLAGDAKAIWTFVVWESTPQGHDFWSREKNRLESGGSLSPEAAEILRAWIRAVREGR